MVHFFPSWGATHSPTGPQAGACSSFGETVVAAALAALGFLTASAFDHTNPGLAGMIRLATSGLSLLWLFGRCCPTTSSSPHLVHAMPTPVYVPPPQPQTSYWNWFSLPTMHPAPVTHTHVTPMGPVHPGGFPTVHRAAPQSGHTMYPAPENRGTGFNPTHPTGFSHSKQAKTTHPSVTPFPETVKMGQDGFPSVRPQPVGGFPSVLPQPVGGFPTVHKASAQADSRILFPAAESRDSSGSKPSMVTFPPTVAVPSMMPNPTHVVGGHSSMLTGNRVPFGPGIPSHTIPSHTIPVHTIPSGGSAFPSVHRASPHSDTQTAHSFGLHSMSSTHSGGFPTVVQSAPQSQHPGNDRIMFAAAERR